MKLLHRTTLSANRGEIWFRFIAKKWKIHLQAAAKFAHEFLAKREWVRSPHTDFHEADGPSQNRAAVNFNNDVKNSFMHN